MVGGVVSSPRPWIKEWLGWWGDWGIVWASFLPGLITWWVGVRPYPLDLYGLNHLVEGEANEGKKEEEEGDEEEEVKHEVLMEEPMQ